jgi:uncharacterized cupin superfamily protein
MMRTMLLHPQAHVRGNDYMTTPSKKKPSDAEITTAKRWPIWEKEPSTFNWHYDGEETFYVLDGDVTVKWVGGELSFMKGNFVSFPEGLDCTWHVKKAIRKHYNFK